MNGRKRTVSWKSIRVGGQGRRKTGAKMDQARRVIRENWTNSVGAITRNKRAALRPGCSPAEASRPATAAKNYRPSCSRIGGPCSKHAVGREHRRDTEASSQAGGTTRTNSVVERSTPAGTISGVGPTSLLPCRNKTTAQSWSSSSASGCTQWCNRGDAARINTASTCASNKPATASRAEQSGCAERFTEKKVRLRSSKARSGTTSR